MAGESPGKSDQRKSSGEATPGERDPRFAVFREPATGTTDAAERDSGSVAVSTKVAIANRTEESEGPEETEDAPESDGGRITPDPDPEPPKAEDTEDAKAEDANEADGDADASERAEEPASVDADTKAEADADAVEADKGDEPDKGDESSKRGKVPSWATAANEDAKKEDAKKAPEGDSKDDADTDARSADAGPVDKPTAVLTTLPRPAVDQPTTTLKVPAKGEEKADEKPESAAERTSTFVPLRRDDRPAAPASPPRPPAASPSPSVPPSVPTALPEAAERTRQQPMPPMPPLDLLAELTNKPAPPETPVRTAVRRVKIYTPLVVLALIVFAVVQSVRPLPAPTLALSADPTFTFEGGELAMPWPDEGQGGAEVEGVGTIGMYGQQKPAPIASVAKVMTAYVILRDHPITGEQVGPKIEVDKKAGEEANRPDESTAPIKEGQQFTQKQMLQLLMIPSGNNAARLLARWDAKSEAAFVEKMNAAAKDLGMTNSTYTDPSGLESSTVSTAADQLKLGKAVMQNDVFREIVNLPQVEIPGIDNMIINNNSILLEPGVSGIKTGSSTPAGGNLLWAANTIVDGQNRRIIGVVMGVQNGVKLWDKLEMSIQNSLKLIKAAQDGVTSARVVKKGDVVGYVDDGLGGRTPVVSTKDLKAVGWGGLQVKLDITEGEETLPHSAASGTVVGEITVGTGTGKVSAPVALQEDLAEPGFGAKLTRVG
ncbi:D-alanyl-D-alanine carboxypeptidase family protein [Streptomyces scopuliridis]|uniref:D-alanyl-D-alanine carboxypeptidase family protein n=1 Tax=Streptomyces scopuliridis TaxID=452529 RepID=UPI0035D7BE78